MTTFPSPSRLEWSVDRRIGKCGAFTDAESIVSTSDLHALSTQVQEHLAIRLLACQTQGKVLRRWFGLYQRQLHPAARNDQEVYRDPGTS